MRFLKNKIHLSQQLKSQHERDKILPKDFNTPKKECEIDFSSTQSSEDTPKKHISPNEDVTQILPKTPEKIRCTKNIVKNYGRAIAKFACSEISLPYLIPILNEKGVSYKEAVTFFTKAKNNIQGIDTFRALVLVSEDDDSTEATCKEIFQRIGEIFIKYFSVNWIFHSKILHRMTYLKYRFKMLRRLKNPKLFTYLKS